MICRICFLDHRIEDCKAILNMQQLLVRGWAKHSQYKMGVKYNISRFGGIYTLTVPIEFDTNGYATKYDKHTLCNIKFIQECSKFLHTAIRDWDGRYLDDKYSYCYEWMIARYPHLREEIVYDGVRNALIQRAFMLTYPEWRDPKPRLNFNLYDEDTWGDLI